MEQDFQTQIKWAGVAVFATTYYFTESVKDAFWVTVAHGLTHYLVDKKQKEDKFVPLVPGKK